MKKNVFFASKKGHVTWTSKKEPKKVQLTKTPKKQILSKTNGKTASTSLLPFPAIRKNQPLQAFLPNKEKKIGKPMFGTNPKLSPSSPLIPEKKTVAEFLTEQESKRKSAIVQSLLSSVHPNTKKKAHTKSSTTSNETERLLQEKKKQRETEEAWIHKQQKEKETEEISPRRNRVHADFIHQTKDLLSGNTQYRKRQRISIHR